MDEITRVEKLLDAKSGLRAIGYVEKCGHNFPPMECPYERCGYREAMARMAELGKENEKLHMQVARLAKSCAELSGKGLVKDARVVELEAAARPFAQYLCDLRDLVRAGYLEAHPWGPHPDAWERLAEALERK